MVNKPYLNILPKHDHLLIILYDLLTIPVNIFNDMYILVANHPYKCAPALILAAEQQYKQCLGGRSPQICTVTKKNQEYYFLRI
jgi:16S rRNA A1518/A1519 N6-dimethyltransferase RsmA/KsgA/DIM1 with predicted DNA glycosylase/AP lyase activity